MSLEDWLRVRQPPAPPALGQRVAELARLAGPGGAPIPEQCLAVAEGALRALLSEGSDSRDRALDLLAVDAIVTFAFEAAADEPQRILPLARSAISRLSGFAAAA
jgi:hypothetical protein